MSSIEEFISIIKRINKLNFPTEKRVELVKLILTIMDRKMCCPVDRRLVKKEEDKT